MAKSDAEMRTHEDAGNDPRVYELGFHLDPELPTEEVKRAYEAIRDAIAASGEVVAEGEPQKIPLAYTISRQEAAGRRDFDSAYFSWVAYETLPENHAEIIRAAGENNRIIRFVDVRTTKDAARHAVEMRELALKAPEQTQEPEAAAGTELDTALENVVV